MATLFRTTKITAPAIVALFATALVAMPVHAQAQEANLKSKAKVTTKVVSSPDVPRSKENLADENAQWAEKATAVPVPAPQAAPAQPTPDNAVPTAPARPIAPPAPSAATPPVTTVAPPPGAVYAPPPPSGNEGDVPPAYSTGEYPPTPVYAAPYAPPPQQYEERPMPPSPYHVWIDGDWYWTGATYAWVPGFWSPGRSGYVYVRPRWTARVGFWGWSAGGWGTAAGVVIDPFPYGCPLAPRSPWYDARYGRQYGWGDPYAWGYPGHGFYGYGSYGRGYGAWYGNRNRGGRGGWNSGRRNSGHWDNGPAPRPSPSLRTQHRHPNGGGSSWSNGSPRGQWRGGGSPPRTIEAPRSNGGFRGSSPRAPSRRGGSMRSSHRR
jgi:hypothetical protein